MTLRDWLSLPDQPIQALFLALPLQLGANRLTALPVVIVQPITLQEKKNVYPEKKELSLLLHYIPSLSLGK